MGGLLRPPAVFLACQKMVEWSAKGSFVYSYLRNTLLTADVYRWHKLVILSKNAYSSIKFLAPYSWNSPPRFVSDDSGHIWPEYVTGSEALPSGPQPSTRRSTPPPAVGVMSCGRLTLRDDILPFWRSWVVVLVPLLLCPLPLVSNTKVSQTFTRLHSMNHVKSGKEWVIYDISIRLGY